MRMTQAKNYWSLFKLAVLLLALLLASCDRQSNQESVQEVLIEPADLVLVNGGIYTVDEDRSTAEAAAVRDGVFVMVGNNAEIEALIGPATRTIDLAGKFALPGFHDSHVHPSIGGYSLLGCALDGLASVEAIIAKVTECASASGEGWLEGFNFDLSVFGQDGPNKSLLDAIDTERPIILWAADGHNAWASSRALELAGITAGTLDPKLGVIEREPDGSPSGTLRETAQELVRDVMPPHTLESNVAALKASVRHLNSFGITSFIEASAGLEEFQSYQALDRAGGMTGRAVVCLTYGGGYAHHYGDEFEAVLSARNDYETERVSNGCIKLFLDGVLEGETAALVEPYLGSGDDRGELIFSPEDLDAVVTRFDGMGLQVHMHAIGDRAVRAGLDAAEAARANNEPGDNRHHISHLQLIHEDDIGRFAALDVTANFQALWAYPDKYITELNLPVVGEKRVQGMYPIGSVVRSGGRIVGGSDWDVSSANPLEAIEVEIRRQDPEKDSGPVLNENERVSLATMIDAYTIMGAWLMHQEDRVGSIEVGKQADMVVLDRDLFEIPATDLSEVQVVMTLLDGEIIYLNQKLRN